jgi:hypothetical protein
LNNLFSKNKFIAGSQMLKRLITIMLFSVIAVLFAAGLGKAISTVGQRILSDPSSIANTVADAFKKGDPSKISEYLGQNTEVLSSPGVEVTVREDESSSDGYRLFRIDLADGSTIATIQASKSYEGENTHFFGLVPGWNTNVNINLPSIGNPFSGVAGLSVRVNEKVITSNSVSVMPGIFKIDLKSESPQFIEGGSQELKVLNSADINLRPRLLAAGGEAAVQAVRENLTRCIGLNGCVSNWTETKNRIVTIPESFSFNMNASGTIAVESLIAGTYEYEYSNWFSNSTSVGTSSYSVDATVSFENGQASVLSLSASG